MPLAWPDFTTGYEQLCQAFEQEMPSTLRLDARFDDVKDLTKAQYEEMIRVCRAANRFPTHEGWLSARTKACRHKVAAKGGKLRPMNATGGFVRHDVEPVCHGLAEWVRDRQHERLADETLSPAYFADLLAESPFADLFGWWIDEWRAAGDRWTHATTYTTAQAAIRYAPSVRLADRHAEKAS